MVWMEDPRSGLMQMTDLLVYSPTLHTLIPTETIFCLLHKMYFYNSLFYYSPFFSWQERKEEPACRQKFKANPNPPSVWPSRHLPLGSFGTLILKTSIVSYTTLVLYAQTCVTAVIQLNTQSFFTCLLLKSVNPVTFSHSCVMMGRPGCINFT